MTDNVGNDKDDELVEGKLARDGDRDTSSSQRVWFLRHFPDQESTLKGAKQSSWFILILAFLTVYSAYSFRSTQSPVFGYLVTVFLVIVFFGIRRMILVAPIIGLGFYLIDRLFVVIVLLTNPTALERSSFIILNVVVITLVMITAFVTSIRAILKYREYSKEMEITT